MCLIIAYLGLEGGDVLLEEVTVLRCWKGLVATLGRGKEWREEESRLHLPTSSYQKAVSLLPCLRIQ